MNRTLTHLGLLAFRPACLVAGVTALQLLASPAHAQLLAVNSVRQNPPSDTPANTKTVLLKSLLKQWESEYHATIFYESKLVDDKRVPAQLVSGSLADKLAAVLPQVALQYKELRTNYFVITGAPAAAGVSAPATAAAAGAVQDIPVSGRVTSGTGEPLPGVTVLVKGTSIGTATDTNGNFSLSVPEGSTLVFSSVGFARQEVPVGSTTTFNIQLKDDTQSLKEVVVVGYGTQSRQEVTTSVASVGAAQIARQPVAGFDQALQGQAPGVQVTAPSGAPGAGINVRVRGNASVSLNGSPLYVVDGVPILPDYQQEITNNNQRLNPLNTINPNDIESIDVLKDGAAAAIYGLRAANGVVVITTKKGRVGQAQVGLSVYFGRQYLRKKLDVLNASQFASEYNDIIRNFNAQQTDPRNIKAIPYPDLNNLPPYNTDWQDEIFRPANQQSYQLNVSGGTDKTRYYVSGGYFKQDGININSGFDRYNFKINLDQHVSDRFRLGTTLNMSRSHTNGSVRSESALGNSGTVLGALTQIPTVPVKNADGTYGTNPFTLSDNPVGNLLETSNQAIVYQTVGNLYGELDVLKNLTFRSSVGLDFRTQTENAFYTRNYPGTSAADPSTRGSANTATNQQVIWLLENTLTYNKDLGDKHHFTLLGGQSMQASDRFTSGAATKGFSTNAVPYLNAGATANGIPGSYADQWSLLSFFGRANYNYDDRYLAMVSFRADASSRFSGANRFGYFPAVSLGWRVSKESFFPQTRAISDLKLRASFGANGNQEIYAYERYSRYAVGYNYQGSGSAILGGISQSNIGNDVRWETTYQYNGGLDLGMLDNRLTFTFDIYKKRTQDLLTNVPIPQSTGAQTLSIIQNVGTVENRGIELGLVTTNVQGANGGFGWTTNFNVSGNRNKIIDLGTLANDAGVQVDRSIIEGNGYAIEQKGSPIGSFFGYRVQGIVQSDAEGNTLPKQNSLAPKAGDIRFVDLNGDGVINASDRTIIGNPFPKAFAGVTNNFTFKGLELSVFFQGSFGNDIYNQNRTITEGQTTALNQSTAVLNHWTPTNTNTDIPRPIFGDPNGNNRFSTRFIEDGSYVRLKNLTLAYTVPTGLSKRAALKTLRIYATAQNLVTWTHYSGYDPEVSADPFSSTGFGRDYGVYPQARTYTVGLNAAF
ncbi:SusC/RagA family TonB-linked outer membrane protein [Hymenobacter convexus]|uniref:SusC/RagA family TonB-linked outer membrane protein n=1 Tax=Hymenobacter sp. CA1UV-4 TaxID=3063782 RepID=UPI002713E70E|nr:TonB-dependent receptor [Hymenobacter sp. CA1UV-4]MDO7849988.1 TonB-dependent receptor [Hymenobacter sp. CA1UV-4]